MPASGASSAPAAASRSASPRDRAPAQPLQHGVSDFHRAYVGDFHRCVSASDMGGVAALLQRAPGFANEANPRTGEAPLHAAVRAKSLPMVQLLVRGGASVVAVDKEGRTAAQAAAVDGAAGMAAWLERA